MAKDVPKEQITSLRFEKELAGMAALVATGTAAAVSASNKIGSVAAQEAYADIETALVNLADETSNACKIL